MQAYLHLAKVQLLNALAYRFEVFTSILSNLVLMWAAVFLWKAAFKGIDEVDGLAQDQMITYAILSIILSSVFSHEVQNMIQARIRDGQIALDFIKPVNVLGLWLAQDLGRTLQAVSFFTPCLLLLGAFFLERLPLPASPEASLFFLLSCLLSYGILWCLAAIVGMLALWFMELGNLSVVKDAIVRVLSGSIVPLWFFPEWVQHASNYLPFEHTYQTPLGIYIGKVGGWEALEKLLLQAGWLAGLAMVLILIWETARKRVLVQGG